MSTICSTDLSRSVLCCYGNYTNRIQVGIITHDTGDNFERVLFPGDKFLFEASLSSSLELYIELGGKTVLFDRIACSRLQTKNESTEAVK